ncbi:PDZ and LIM domain protein 5a isoform X1 [Triplophysa rosa]|uniref:PDZ and LIM domain protein 5 n=1 Tax=Triplophysa rosa TaxID=992332 RepID=A0A9W7X228_TRIRA|nr:PDZ and LIM domain protein 5a isoform X1 [Triplophysa rosa]XP_057178866.1 PDZ and LIM domain protein 5a isoform X1 [Triplophysa rosa]XP_057178874.1 PDZ and LIM domain protein 5a isoform X1 [Triplophysa rosa]XP_057178881.1 PDZ and LIM domain protein 5a isoform X1 [Triplophysa rosa]KAI7812360.1 PDZ and LIM domain protein 5 [Triplophysa rosa]
MSSNYIVALQGPAPWGFRLQGGKDFNMPLAISRMIDGGKAAKAGISVGDLVLSIDGIRTDAMNHLEAQNKIKSCTGSLNLNLQKASNLPKPEAAPKDDSVEIIKPVPIPCSSDITNSTPITPSTYKSAQLPGGAGSSCTASIPPAASAFASALSAPVPNPPAPPSLADVTAASPNHLPAVPRPSVYNTPIDLYSSENACEVAMGQRRGLLESQGESLQLNGPPRKPITETDIEFYHVATHGDASRKRIMEDTEDWHPRTGTSQSRSFRILAQITGTESDRPEGTESTKTTNEDSEEPSAHVTCPVKTMIKAPGTPVRNTTGLITPTFGVVSNSTPLGPALDRPMPRPHPEDEASLVQMAEHIPAGTRTPMCAHCHMVIRGPFLVAMGKSWHPEEFTCARCSVSLSELGFVEEKGCVYCQHCYQEFFAPTCARCRYKIMGEVINALKQTWHVYCFLCAYCQQPIRNNTFHLEDGEPYCERDYYSLFGTGCRGCDFPIEAGDSFLEALGFTWHDTCFVCTVCSVSLEGQTFFSKKDKLLCKKHAYTFKI